MVVLDSSLHLVQRVALFARSEAGRQEPALRSDGSAPWSEIADRLNREAGLAGPNARRRPAARK